MRIGTAPRAARVVLDGIKRLARLDNEAEKVLFQESVASAKTRADIDDLLE